MRNFLFGLRNKKRVEGNLALPSKDIELIVPVIKAINIPIEPVPASGLALTFERSPITNPFAADMIIMYAVNRPSHLEYISNKVASDTGLSRSDIHQIALKNLPSHISEVQTHDCGQGLYGLSAGGTFEVSLLLLDQVWEQLEPYLPGQPLAAAPSRDLLFVIGSAQPNASELIASRAHLNLPDKQYTVSQSVIARREGKWLALSN